MTDSHPLAASPETIGAELDDAISADILGGVGVLVDLLGRAWVEKELGRMQMPGTARLGQIPRELRVRSRHVLLAGILDQIQQQRLARKHGGNAIAGSLAFVGYVGNALVESRFPRSNRNRARLRDPEDAPAVALEAIANMGYRTLGFELDPKRKGPEFFVQAAVPTAVECKSKLRFEFLVQEGELAHELCANVLSSLEEMRAVAQVQITANGELRPQEWGAIVSRLRTMLKLGVTTATCCDAKYGIEVRELPRNRYLQLNELPETRGYSMTHWQGGPHQELGPVANPRSAAVATMDHKSELAERFVATLDSALHNLRGAEPAVVYLGLPMLRRELIHKILDESASVLQDSLATHYGGINAVVLLGFSTQAMNLSDSALFLDGRTVLHQWPSTPFSCDFKLLDDEAVGNQFMEAFTVAGKKLGFEGGSMTPAEARARGLYVPGGG